MAKRDKLGTALEKALNEAPDDRATLAAYADHLAEQADPKLSARGAFIQVQLALEAPGCAGRQREELERREKELLAAHQRDWLGRMAPFLAPEVPPEEWHVFPEQWHALRRSGF